MFDGKGVGIVGIVPSVTPIPSIFSEGKVDLGVDVDVVLGVILRPLVVLSLLSPPTIAPIIIKIMNSATNPTQPKPVHLRHPPFFLVDLSMLAPHLVQKSAGIVCSLQIGHWIIGSVFIGQSLSFVGSEQWLHIS